MIFFIHFSAVLISFSRLIVGCELQAIYEIKAVKEPKCVFVTYYMS